MSVSETVKRRLLLLTNGVCFYCDEKLYLKKKGRRQPVTVDHYIPLSKGGTDDYANRVPACKKCNNLKADMMPDEFMRLLNERRNKG